MAEQWPTRQEGHGTLDSYVQGAASPPLLETTIGEALDRAAQSWPDSDALVCVEQGIRLNWTEFRDRVEAFAAGLLEAGLKPGDRVGIWSLNRAEWAITQFAAAKAGLILVAVNPAYRLSELEFALNKVGCAALILSPPFKTSDYPGMIRALAPELDESEPGALQAERLPHLRLVVQMGESAIPGAMPFAAIEAVGRAAGLDVLRATEAAHTPHDPVNIQFTSGTTGSPKGVTLSHRNILNNGYFTGEAMSLSHRDRICIPVPLYHCFGMVMGNLASVTHGAAMIYPGEGFDPLATLRTVATERCTALYGVPTMYIAELDHPEFADFDLSTLRTGIMAGSPCPIEIMRKVIDRMHIGDITICYGMTETSPVSFQSGEEASLERRVTTVGRIHPHLEAKVVDEAGMIVSKGVPGELCTRGYSVMLGYWDEAEQTVKVKDADGWMHTGDLATIDEEGYGKIVGRIKDLVIRGGENLYPREIEDYLYRHHKVQDVQVFGVPDERYGEELCAWIILSDGHDMDEEELRAFCRGQIAHQKVPRYVRFVDTFPLTVTGKVQKFIMRDIMIAELGLVINETA